MNRPPEMRVAMYLINVCAVFLSFLILVNARSDKISFTLAIDDTMSMQQEIDGVKRTANRIFDAVLKTGSALIENYVLVTINDPSVELRTITDKPEEFKRQLELVNVHSFQNYDCPEMALTGVELAMQNSLPHSLVYVFTDSGAKDSNLLEKVRNLAYRKQIQIIFILTDNFCKGVNDPIYTDLATTTNGMVFKVKKAEVNEILSYAVESVKTKRTVIGKGTFPPGAHNLNVSVDPTVKDLIVVAVGTNVQAEVHNPDGTLAPNKLVIDTADAKAVKVNSTEPGSYDFHIISTSNTSIVVQANTNLDFYHGFSLKKPLSIPGTSPLPLPGVKSHLAIDVICDEDVLFEKVELLDLEEKVIMEIPLEKLRTNFYVTEAFTPPNGSFYISIKGILLKSNFKIKRTTSTPVQTQNRALVKFEDKSPIITMEKATIDAEYDKPLTITCDVQAYPAPTIIWYDDKGNEVTNEAENYDVPYGYKSTLEINNVNKNTTYTCKSSNKHGEATSKVEIKTKRKNYFDVLSRPEDKTIEYKKSGNIICSIDSDPPSTITWEKDSKELVSDSKIEISSDKTTFYIKEMTPDLIGSYYCVVNNGANLTALGFKIFISGVAPAVNIDKSKINIEYNEPIHVDCKITGFPEPKIVWKDLETGVILPSIVNKSDDVNYDYKSTLEIGQSKKNGTYQCSASNNKGDDNKIIEIETRVHFNVLEEPKDINIEFKKSGTINCEVDANPPVKITWHKNGVKVYSNDSFDITESKDGISILKMKNMRPFMKGNYICRAANVFHTQEFEFNVFLTGSAPKTSIYGSPKINAEYDVPLQLLCKVFGYPEPDVTWHDKDTGDILISDVSAVDEPYDYGNTMSINSVNRNATYTCRAKNALGENSTDVQVETIRKTYFDIVVSPKDTKIVYKKSAKINCVVDSYPPSTITWNKGDKEIAVDSKIEIMDNGTTLHLKRMTPELVGTYSCKVQNGHNSSAIYFNILILGVAPVVSIEDRGKEIVEYDAPIHLKCKVTGFPAPNIIWKETESGKILPSTTESSVEEKYDYVNILHINNSKKNATYQCLASNFEGVDSKNVEVVTLVYINFVVEPKDLNVQFRKSASVKCKVDAKPPAILMWYKHGTKIRYDDNLDVLYGSDGSSLLTVTNMNPDSADEYSCRAVNDFFTDEINFKIMIIQTAAKTLIDGAPKINAEYDAPLSILCKVSGYPEPDIVWLNKNTGKEVLSSLAPADPFYDHGKILQINRVSKNETYICKAMNSLGDHSSQVQIETIRKHYFDILEQPKDTTIKYKENGQLYCNVDADPPAEIVWYKDTTELNNDTHISISKNLTVISIKNMEPALTGLYICRATNENNDTTFDFKIFMSGTIPPKIDKSLVDTNLQIQVYTVLEGSKAVIECRIVGGDPPPTISWSSRLHGASNYTKLVENDSKIVYNNVTRHQAGFYRCLASNAPPLEATKARHEDRLWIELIVEYGPSIKRKNKKSVSLLDGENKNLFCDASGEPKPTITWLLNNVTINKLDYDIYSDGSIRIKASERNVGEFTCVAKNKHGEAKTTTNVFYTGAVQIDIPDDTKIEVKEGEDIKMPCVADGYPRPKIGWTFYARNSSTPRLLKSNEDSPHILVISSAQLERSGYYVCDARNIKKAANMTYEVIVNAKPRILEKDTKKVFRPIKGDLVQRLPCMATGWPKPDIRWVTKGLNVALGTEWYDKAGDGALLIKNIVEGGQYFCIASNKHGTDEKSFDVLMEEFPAPLPPSATKTLYIGDRVVINCDLPHKRVDRLRWYKDGKLLVEGELILNYVGRKDSGLYTCRVSTLSGSDSMTVRVVVR